MRVAADKVQSEPRSIAADRLCALHLGPVVAALPAATASQLLGRWADSARGLVARLEVLTAKKRTSDRSVGPERYAPAEAINRLAGGRGGGRAPR